MRLVPSRRHFLWAATFSAFVVVAGGVFTKFFLHWIYRKPKLGGLEEARVWFFGKSMLVQDRTILSELDSAIQKSNISIWWTKWIELRLCLGSIESGNLKLGAGSLYVCGCYPFFAEPGACQVFRERFGHGD